MNRRIHNYTLTTGDGRTSRIRLAGAPLGSGGDAAIYPILDDPGQVAKIYHDPGKDPRRHDKIRTMLSAPPDLPPIRQNGATYIQIAWPTGIIEDSRTGLAGYAMPFVDLARSTVLDNLLSRKIRRAMSLPDFYGLRVVAASNLAALVAALHARGHHIIDLKPVNLNVYLDTFFTALLDCDGLSIQGANGKRFNAHQYTDGYIAPEALRQRLLPKDLGEDQDRFALAVVLFQLLNRGIHPYQGVPRKGATLPTDNSGRIRENLYAYGRTANRLQSPSPWSLHDYLEDETRDLFDRAFGRDPRRRPSAAQWTDHLRRLTDPVTGTLKRCPRNAAHGCFSKGCGFCAIENTAQSARKKQIRIKTAKPHSPVAKTRKLHGRFAASPIQTMTVAIVRKTSITRSPQRRPIKFGHVMGVLLFIVLAFFLYLDIRHSSNIHEIIRRCDQQAFLERVGNNKVKWYKLTFEDARNAIRCPDERVFCTIIEHLFDDEVPFYKSVLKTLVERNRDTSAIAYIKKINYIGNEASDADIVAFMLNVKSSSIREAYFRKLKFENPRMDYKGFKPIFLNGQIYEIQALLAWGANPNCDIRIWDSKSPILNAFFNQHAFADNYRWSRNRPADSVFLRNVLERYAGPFKIPGISIIRDLYRKGKNPNGWGRDYIFSIAIRPLTIAVVREDMSLMHVLVAAGADVYKSAMGDRTILDMAPSLETFRALKLAATPSDPIQRAMYEDDPEKLMAALKATKTKMQTADLLRSAERWESLRIVDMLISRDKVGINTKDPEALMRAYESGNPLLLAYYLKIGSVPSPRYITDNSNHSLNRSPVQGRSRKEDSGAAGRAASKRARTVNSLIERAERNDRWDMAFVMEDHVCRWSGLHLAVLRQDTATIRSILKSDPSKLEQADARGRTPLALAAAYQCDKSYQVLMDFKPNLDAPDKRGRTPIMQAAAYCNASMVADLLARGAQVTSPGFPSCAAALKPCKRVADALDEMRVREQRNNGSTPYDRYHGLCQNFERTVALLIQAAKQEGLKASCEAPAGTQ